MSIAGYRVLTAEEIALINEVKAVGESLELLFVKLQREQGTDARWLAIGKTNLQQGLMAWTRSIAQPTNF